jgi:hypothetical protein
MSVRFNEELQVRSIRPRLVSNAAEDLIDEVLPLSVPADMSNVQDPIVEDADAIPPISSGKDADDTGTVPFVPAFQFVQSCSLGARAMMFSGIVALTFFVYQRTLYRSVMGRFRRVAGSWLRGRHRPPSWIPFIHDGYILASPAGLLAGEYCNENGLLLFRLYFTGCWHA